MRRLNTVVVSSGFMASLLAIGCAERDPISGPDLPIQAKPAGAGLKVTPPMLNFSELGGTATLTASASASPISVAVSTPECVSVSLKSGQPKQSKFTVTATAAGSCTLTVTDGATGNVQVPVTVTVAPSLVVSTLAAGLFHTCGLDVNGAAWCWGDNGFGQLGNSNTVGSVTANPTPEPVVGGLTFVSLTAGHHHTCGLTSAGAAYCWGGNRYGQLGNSTNSGVEFGTNPTPLPVDGNLAFSILVAGVDHACGITPQGVMYCWGKNYQGQLGTGTDNGTIIPHPTPAPVDGNLTFTAVTGGTNHTCGVATGGAVYCWGNNFKGQLGNSQDLGDELAAHPTPTQVPGVSLASLEAGGNWNCGLTSTGSAWCWGDNLFGQLAGTTDGISPTPVEVPGGISFVSLDAGGGHVCGLVSQGALYCWGANLLGQLGTAVNFGTSTPSYVPTLVNVAGLARIAVNAAHTCGLTPAGVAWCWGYNRYGQLGTLTNNNTDTGVPTPDMVLGGITFATP